MARLYRLLHSDCCSFPVTHNKLELTARLLQSGFGIPEVLALPQVHKCIQTLCFGLALLQLLDTGACTFYQPAALTVPLLQRSLNRK